MLDKIFAQKKFLFFFLAFCVLSSKNVIIYNEETLVTLSFVLFVLFVFHYFGNTLKESLDERSQAIRVECQNFLQYKEQSLQELLAEHQKIGQLQGALSQLMHFTKGSITQFAATAAPSLATTFSQQMTQKCSELRNLPLAEKVQSVMAENQQRLVLVRCGKQNHLSAPVLKNAIQLLTSALKKR